MLRFIKALISYCKGQLHKITLDLERGNFQESSNFLRFSWGVITALIFFSLIITLIVFIILLIGVIDAKI